ncbi:MAG TPA: iron-containing alcohol dehydrogenase [Bacteroidales bacterium]|jgi:NADP-dependent alcohol dehydrogenase|nr:iron-containing alcohol dehydrogenase [Bacteroidales bacterium]HPE39533.1 iron-containing alcohol dehydrogenase [Bacteroidales bacterium]
MNNFTFQNPTKLIFGKGTIAKLAKEIPTDKKLMITFGSGSVKKNGVYDQVVKALEGKKYVEFWGIEPNPTVETLRKAIQLGKENHVDYLLAVGGGSVLDGTKLISAAIPYDGDPWDLVQDPALIDLMIPHASVLTLPATGSEMNKGAVISNKETHEKCAFYSSHPQFSILDPEVTFSLPDYQVACGLADTFVHVVEQYLTVPNQSLLMDRWSESILQTLVEIAPKIKANPKDYDLMSQFMLCATMALNGFTAMGVSQDWATHMIGHEITALHGVTHGHTLAIILPGTMSVMKEQKWNKIIQLGERVFQIFDGDESQKVDQTIAHTEQFFRSLGLQTRLHELEIGEESIQKIKNRFLDQNTLLGENGNIDGWLTEKILYAVL